MGFDIALEWDAPSPDSVARSRRVADALLATVPGLTEFPLDPALIAETIGVPVADVWDNWFHVELHAPEAMADALVHLWSDAGSVELSSDPPNGCAAALASVGSLLAALASQGLRVVDPLELLAEYEAQRSRVRQIAELVGGVAEQSAAADRPRE